MMNGLYVGNREGEIMNNFPNFWTKQLTGQMDCYFLKRKALGGGLV